MIFVSGNLYANSLFLTNGSSTSQSIAAHTIKVQFDISWSNSWRDAVNYDAVWAFIKYSTDAGSTWHHGTLKGYGQNPSGFATGTGTLVQIVVPIDGKGCFLQRAGNGTGTLMTQGVQLVWDYATDGVSDTDANGLDTRIKIFGVEMVYIPEGSFLAGDASANLAACFKTGKTQALPISINAENAIVFNAENAGPYYYQCGLNSGEYIDGSVFTVPSGFPKGFKAFYLMKDEISQGLWVSFFNTLTDTQKSARDITSSYDGGKGNDAVTYRNAVSWTSGDASLVHAREDDRACNYLSWPDLCAFADWAGLRPMTELEFEKACRGPANAVNNEFAWGNAAITAAANISGTENGTETITDAGANACYNRHWHRHR
ncbi:MAG: SUMF1/EgtB/PvdO family nonheme iron enzyme, partial [Candidatus Omnitrophota bacterium]